MLNERPSSQALASIEAVREFSESLLKAANAFQSALHNISKTDMAFGDAGYGVLMEVYGIRTRAYLLQNDASNHIVCGLTFTQHDLLDMSMRAAKVAEVATTLKQVRSIVLSVATFSVSLGADRAKVVGALYEFLMDDIFALEVNS